MPYDSVSSLPASVKRGLDEKQQRQWLHVFNSAYKSCQDKKGDDCDGSAYRQANGTVKKKKDLDSGWEVWQHQVSQQAANYDPMGGVNGKSGQACANCNWFSSPDGCILVQGDISPTGVSDFWREVTKYEPEPIPVYVVNEAAKQNILDRVKSKLLGETPSPRATPEGAIFILKQLDPSGEERTRVMMRVTNNFMDRHGEIIAEEAHKDYEQYVDTTKDYPEFWLWHMPGSRWGQADFVSYADGFLTVSGLVDKGYEHVAERLASRKDIGVSHGFYALSFNDDSIIDVYRTFECSPLPLDQAANQWNPLNTIMTIAKEAELPIPQAKRDFAIKDLGIPESVLDTWERENKDFGDGLKELDIAYKSKGEEKDGTTDGATTSNNPDPTPSSGSLTIEDIRGAITEAVAPMQTAISELQEKQKQYEGGLHEAVSQVITNGNNGAAPRGFDPTSSEKNKSKEDDAKADDDWFEKVVAKGETY